MDKKSRIVLLGQFKGIRIYFPSFAKAYSAVQSAIEMSLVTEEPNGAIICGPSGTGKTSLCSLLYGHYLKSYTEESGEGASKKTTAAFFEVPADVTIRQLLERMLERVGVFECRGSPAHLTSMLVTRLRKMETDVVFLDEIQRLCIPSAETIRLKALASIVSFCNELGKPVILAGTEECRHIADANDSFGNRYPRLAVLNFFQYEPAGDSVYHRTLQKLDEELHALIPMDSQVHLNDLEIAAGLFVATSGNLKLLRTVIYIALEQCLRRNDSRGLERRDFFYACDQIKTKFNLLSHNNAFSVDLFSARQIIQDSHAQLNKWRVPE